jgi:hypothetical protein
MCRFGHSWSYLEAASELLLLSLFVIRNSHCIGTDKQDRYFYTTETSGFNKFPLHDIVSEPLHQGSDLPLKYSQGVNALAGLEFPSAVNATPSRSPPYRPAFMCYTRNLRGILCAFFEPTKFKPKNALVFRIHEFHLGGFNLSGSYMPSL